MKGLLTPTRLTISVAAGLAALLATMLACSLVGTADISISRIFDGPGTAASQNPDYEIFVRVRMPRVILAAIVGMALACAGTVLQALLRNPLADPYIMGISSGAGLGAITASLLGLTGTFWGLSWQSAMAFVAAVATVSLVWFIGRLAARGQMTALLLAGVVVNAFFSSLIMFLTSIARGEQVHATIFWLMGNMTEQKPAVLWVAASLVAAGILGLMLMAKGMNAITFGEDEARSLGVNTARLRIAAFGLSAFVTAVAVSLSGLIGFVGLIVPHAVRLVFGADHRLSIPMSCIVGAIFLVLADTLARVVVAPAQLPVGVVTAMVGGPFFLVLLYRHTRRIGGLAK